MLSFRSLVRASFFATFVLIAIGGLVRATKSGLGCGTDWPHCNGRAIPLFGEPAVAIEYSHRLVAGVVLILLGLIALKAWREHRDNPRIVRAATGAFGLVMFQAVLGAVVVKLELEAESVVLHLATALSLLGLLIYLWAITAAAEGERWPTDRPAGRSLFWTALSVLALLLVGSYISGTAGAGAAFDDWPLMDGKLVPDLAIEAQALHFAHRFLAAVVGVVVAFVCLREIRRAQDRPLVRKLAHSALGLFVLEVLIGAANVFSGLNAAFVTAHLAVGAAIWACLVGAACLSAPSVLEASAGHPARRVAMAEGSR